MLASTSVLKLLSPVVRAVFALHAEVDVGADAAVVQRLDRANVVAHAQEDLRRLVLAQQPQRVHLGWKTEKRRFFLKIKSAKSSLKCEPQISTTHFFFFWFPDWTKEKMKSFGIKACLNTGTLRLERKKSLAQTGNPPRA